MPLHFSLEEYDRRMSNLLSKMENERLDAVLLFKPESMYYLTGYDSTGFIVFQSMVVTVSGEITLMTRSPDVAQAHYSSNLKDVRVWVDGADASPATDLRDILKEYGLQNKRVGIETDTFGLTARRWREVEAAMSGFCDLVEASNLVNGLRVVKSAEEIEYVRKAGQLADAALDRAKAMIAPGTSEGALYGAMHDEIFKGGGFYPASRFAMGSGDKALLVRTTCDTGTIGENDQIQMEFAAPYRHYHAGLMRTFLTGPHSDQHKSMHSVCIEALHASIEACKEGLLVGDIFQAHADTFDAAGFKDARFNACGYCLGATYAPSWMDHPMIHSGSQIELQENMVFFLLMILVDHERDLTMSIGETVVVGRNSAERLSNASLELPQF